MQQLTDSTEILADGPALQSRLADDGYLYFRRLLDGENVRELREIIVGILRDSRWVTENGDGAGLDAGDSAVGAGALGFHGTYTAIQMRQELHEFAVQPALIELAERVLDEPVFCHPMHIVRINPPVGTAVPTPIHQDYRLIQGTADTLTTWIPLADAPEDVGGLKVLHGSHREGLLPVEAVDAPGGVASDVSADDPRWRSTSYTAGDVLLFTSLTVHGGKPNTSKRLRLSLDFRYQSVREPVCDYDGSFKPHHYPRVPDWPTSARGWTSTSSIEVPAGVPLVPRLDPADPDMAVPSSRFVRVDG